MCANKLEAEPLLFLLGVNHRSAPMELREQLFIEEARLAELLPQVKERFGFLEFAAISTCNRFELMGVATGAPHEAVPEQLVAAFLELQRAGSAMHKYTEEQLRQATYVLTERDAVTHIYRVASSLDSLVLGETQITGQFKDAIALALKLKTLGPNLSRLSQEALATAKKIRTQTAIGRKTVSISHAAVELAQKVFGELSDHKFLVIGAGEMAQVAARYVLSYKPKGLMIANRTVERAQDLVRELGFGTAYGLDDLPKLLAQADVVISSTSASSFVLNKAQIKNAQAQRRQRPLVLLDIALPRDIDPACGKLDDVFLFDIDDLQQVVGANVEERQKAAEEANTLIERSTEQFEAWRRTFALKPALAGFRAYLDELVQKEAKKTLGKEQYKVLTDKQRAGLDALMTALVSKISAEASRQVMSPPTGYYPEQLADALSVLFPAPEKKLGSADEESA